MTAQPRGGGTTTYPSATVMAEYARLTRVMIRALAVVEAGGGALAEAAAADATRDWFAFGIRHPDAQRAVADEFDRQEAAER